MNRRTSLPEERLISLSPDNMDLSAISDPTTAENKALEKYLSTCFEMDMISINPVIQVGIWYEPKLAAFIDFDYHSGQFNGVDFGPPPFSSPRKFRIYVDLPEASIVRLQDDMLIPSPRCDAWFNRRTRKNDGMVLQAGVVGLDLHVCDSTVQVRFDPRHDPTRVYTHWKGFALPRATPFSAATVLTTYQKELEEYVHECFEKAKYADIGQFVRLGKSQGAGLPFFVDFMLPHYNENLANCYRMYLPATDFTTHAIMPNLLKRCHIADTIFVSDLKGEILEPGSIKIQLHCCRNSYLHYDPAIPPYTPITHTLGGAWSPLNKFAVLGVFIPTK